MRFILALSAILWNDLTGKTKSDMFRLISKGQRISNLDALDFQALPIKLPWYGSPGDLRMRKEETVG